MTKHKDPPALTRHHRVPRSANGSNHKDNISMVKDSAHKAFHLLFSDRPPEEIADILNAVWIDKQKKLLVVPASEYQEIVKMIYNRRRTP